MIMFDKGPPPKPANDILLEVRNWGRENLAGSEDNWTAEELAIVRKRLPPEYRDVDTHNIKIWMQNTRKASLDTKITVESMVARLSRAARDYAKEKKRKGVSRSARYEDYITSDEWRAVALAHHKACGHR